MWWSVAGEHGAVRERKLRTRLSAGRVLTRRGGYVYVVGYVQISGTREHRAGGILKRVRSVQISRRRGTTLGGGETTYTR